MADPQESLVACFDGFISGIQEKLAYTASLHVGVVTSSDYFQNVVDCPEVGDLIVKTGGPDAAGALCLPFA